MTVPADVGRAPVPKRYSDLQRFVRQQQATLCQLEVGVNRDRIRAEASGPLPKSFPALRALARQLASRVAVLEASTDRGLSTKKSPHWVTEPTAAPQKRPREDIKAPAVPGAASTRSKATIDLTLDDDGPAPAQPLPSLRPNLPRALPASAAASALSLLSDSDSAGEDPDIPLALLRKKKKARSAPANAESKKSGILNPVCKHGQPAVRAQVQNPAMSQRGEHYWCCYLAYGHPDRCNYRQWEETASHSIATPVSPAAVIPVSRSTSLGGSSTGTDGLRGQLGQHGPASRSILRSSHQVTLSQVHSHQLPAEEAVGEEGDTDTVRELQRQNARHLEMIEHLRRTNDSLLMELQTARGQEK